MGKVQYFANVNTKKLLIQNYLSAQQNTSIMFKFLHSRRTIEWRIASVLCLEEGDQAQDKFFQTLVHNALCLRFQLLHVTPDWIPIFS